MIISELIKNINECADAKSAIVYMVTLQTKMPSVKYKDKNGAYVWKNYYVLPSYTNRKSEFLTNLLENLKMVNPICKISSPELIDIAGTKDGNFSVLIYRINDSENADLVPYLQTKGATKEKIELFISEQVKLLELSGYYNPEIFNSVNHFYLTPDTKNIVFEAWNDLKRCENEIEKNNFLQNLNNLL